MWNKCHERWEKVKKTGEPARGDDVDMPENSMQGEHVEGEGASHFHSGFQDIIKEIHSLKAKFRTDFAPFNKDIKQEMKEEFQTLI